MIYLTGILLFPDAQVAFMKHLSARGIGVQEPLPDKNGDPVAFYTFPSPDGKGKVEDGGI